MKPGAEDRITGGTESVGPTSPSRSSSARVTDRRLFPAPNFKIPLPLFVRGLGMRGSAGGRSGQMERRGEGQQIRASLLLN